MADERKKKRRVCTAQGESEMGKEEGDLKRGHVRVLNECDRSHQGALDRIRAEPCTVSACVMWAFALEQT
jgi:hypothetical protein